ncbi:hypothetical protein [Pararcticibacter amylolyticus]|uniref:hypothetical protein n=1 Tax=Pararcticibacter amylolyticus TaxID=2173175 RepID=UPI001304FE14|nr:hypothetical protein [Pararcticibacter amylolyticus]
MKKSQEQIFQFVNSHSQEESKQLLWTLLKSAVVGNLGDLLPIERENLLLLLKRPVK